MVPDVIYKMEKQVEMLSRQFQSVNAKLSGNQKPSVAPKQKQKQVIESKKSLEPQAKIPRAVKRLTNRQVKKETAFVSPVEAPKPPVVEQTVSSVQNLIPPSSDPTLLVFWLYFF